MSDDDGEVWVPTSVQQPKPARLVDPDGTVHEVNLPTLAEFLLARIAEDEAEARERRQIAERRWAEIRAAGAMPAFVVLRTDEPEFTFATCAAHRRIVELHGSGDAWCDHCSGYGDEPSDTCPTIRALASVYADHPDYRQEWRP